MVSPGRHNKAPRSVFAAALTAEIIQLRERVQVVEQHWEQRRRRCVAEAETPEGFVRLRAQLERHGCLMRSRPSAETALKDTRRAAQPIISPTAARTRTQRRHVTAVTRQLFPQASR